MQIPGISSPVSWMQQRTEPSHAHASCSFSHRYMNWDRVLRMMSRGKLDVLPMVSHKFKLEDCVEAFEAKDKLKVMFEIHPEE